jgi:hemolysin activation/secretion protein
MTIKPGQALASVHAGWPQANRFGRWAGGRIPIILPARWRGFWWLTQTLLAVALCSSAARSQVLPPPPKSEMELRPEARLLVKGYHFEGNTAFSDEELAKVTERFTNKELRTEELEEARRAVTLHYVNHGFINSGAIIPDQDPTNGIVTVQIIEGKLTDIELQGNKWLADGYITSRVRRWSKPPLILVELQEGLQLLRQNPNVNQINAELKPGTAPGESLLDLRVVDAQPFRLGLQVDNHRPPSVGAEQISLLAADLNLTGHSDPLQLRYGIASTAHDGLGFDGLDNIEGNYSLPFTRYDTSIGLNASRLNTSLIEETFTELNIESLTRSLGAFLRQPVYQTANREAAVAIAFDHRRNNTWLLGSGSTSRPERLMEDGGLCPSFISGMGPAGSKPRVSAAVHV